MEINTNNQERKTISINPELFKMSGAAGKNRTKKNLPNDPNKAAKIRVKNTGKPAPKISTIKRNILKMIRNHQYDRKKTEATLYARKEEKPDRIQEKIPISISSFETDFTNSLDYLSSLASEVEKKKKNATIRNYPIQNIENPRPYQDPLFESENIPLENMSISEGLPYMLQPPKTYLPPPKYGCLKNGTLPTYRNWKNQTQKYYSSNPVVMTPNPNIQMNLDQRPNPIISNLDQKIREMSKITKMDNKKKQLEIQEMKISKKPKQKKILRRTFHIGKSKVHPRVSVLVSNKTIRANTTLKKQQLKNIPIVEVKKYLLKNGFIKVGTTSPNDVLREMYENAKIIGGEVKNHNPENLLYNYFHANETDMLV